MPTVNLSQMVDLALGTPEVGACNFNVLHTLLHAMLQKMNMTDVKANINESDRDFLSSPKHRVPIATSVADSGREDSEDGLSMVSGTPFDRPPYHQLESKVARIAEQLEGLNALPSNGELFTKAKAMGDGERPMVDMWQNMQLKKRVDSNEDGVTKLMSLVEDLMKEMQTLKDDNTSLNNKIKDLNFQDLMNRLNDLETLTSNLNEKMNQLPTADEIAQFVTWPMLEDALHGIRRDFENLKPHERIVMESTSQTDARPPSRPTSTRPSSSASSGPSSELMDVLERLGRLNELHDVLNERVTQLEALLDDKLDKSAIEGLSLGIPPDLLDQINQIQQELEALNQGRDKSHSINTSRFNFLPMTSIASRTDNDSEYITEEGADGTHKLEDSESIYLKNTKASDWVSDPSALQDLKIKVESLEEKVRLFQNLFQEDSGYGSDFSGLKSFLTDVETHSNKILEDISQISQDSEKLIEDKDGKDETPEKAGSQKRISVSEESKKHSYDILSIFGMGSFASSQTNASLAALLEKPSVEMEAITEGDNGDLHQLSSEMNTTNQKLKQLATVLNGQLRTMRTKVGTLDQEMRRMAKGVEFALLRTKVAGASNMPEPVVLTRRDSRADRPEPVVLTRRDSRADRDSEALSRAQYAIAQLQNEVEKLHTTTQSIVEENNKRTEQIETLYQTCDKLQEVKADKEYVAMEVDVKADKRQLDGKVNSSLFDSTCEEINKLLQDMFDKLSGQENSWKHAVEHLSNDLDGKLDRLELDPLKAWLEARLKAINTKVKRNEWSEDDAAGLRKQLIQRFHCISCDRPVEVMPTGAVPSLPTHSALPPTQSPRPYTTFELDQIRQHAKSGLTQQNVLNFERAMAMKEIAKLRKSDQHAFLVHFGHEFLPCGEDILSNPEMTDYYATNRPCGGSHTLTYPHKRITRLTHMNHLFREEDGTMVYPANSSGTKDELDIQGADGHMYKSKNRLDTKLPAVKQAFSQNVSQNANTQRNSTSQRGARPMSSGGIQQPQAPSSGAQRPASARRVSSPGLPSPHDSRPLSSRTTPTPQQSPDLVHVEVTPQEQQVSAN